MMVNLNSILPQARKGKYAIGAFNVYNYETIKGVIDAAAELRVPVVVAFGERYLANMSFDEVYSLVKVMSKNVEVPVVLHLDHCKTFENIVKAIRAGFTSVMFDGSSLPFKENVEKTKEVVKIAHAVGVSVEAELGSIAGGEGSSESDNEETTIYTDPKEAEEFVELTQVDALAVSIGTVHGLYTGEPKINIDILKEIASRVQIPLVLHGGSGTPEEILKECIRNGIAKININTEISIYTLDKIAEILNENKNKVHFSNISLKVIECVKEVTKKHIKLFYET
ncbi:fructose-bisphosphate aldolase class II [Caldicellulosiruptor bescii]|uniref:Ketose-bisphosphate aldolase n=2 Tax=Caldicellulosiruptor bescii TaxID=31899 RepID=B9ML92_CALBD|nr:class II fructose-bisphosphate aldolase [Caldicellulosiruptor bescii]ACM61082.1 ketose-bisphosphate aldolase [Caldicellulosiruptor bescii DSM 6725]PBC89105.1 fructose-bisphosphate aldolase class II [Caldicellulosiruptor bescii]PBC91413.1 fructose-bisphosphate aldolase class II [Caldicellulosiruptor bescii]PBD03176.1 fructose-bisphosphate aldolase class II [Caldicellulosiruptor bescii]PBD07211.1 fructose-bisphosphate aldolase class II [Caldicellulosiruptor bescii]